MHRVLKGKVSGRKEILFEGVVKCQKCGRVGDIILRELRKVSLKLIVSWMERSERTSLEIEPDSEISVGDVLDTGLGKIEVTAIESKGRRVPEALVKDVDTVWAKRADKIRIKVSILIGRRTRSRDIFVSPEKELRVGELLDTGRERVVIEKIKVGSKILYKGGAAAIDIVRIYARS